MATDRLILASASTRRRELLALICDHFDVAPSPHEEPERKSNRVPFEQWVQALAYYKARGVVDRFPACWVLGADTIVVCDGRLLGKPRDLTDARAMLELQARHVSDVLTGICLVRQTDTLCRNSDAATTRVWMRDDPADREAYLAGGDWQGKAGAYGIQTVGDRLVERIEGSFSNVVGLPLEQLLRMLRAAGIPVHEPVTAAKPSGLRQSAPNPLYRPSAG